MGHIKVLQVQKGHDGQSSTSSKTDEQCSTAILFKQDKVLLELGYVGHSSTDFEHGVKCST